MMTLENGINVLKNKYPHRVVDGYWIKNGTYIFNTKSFPSRKGFDEPGQYVVTDSGDVYATNPFRSDLDPSDMKKLK